MWCRYFILIYGILCSRRGLMDEVSASSIPATVRLGGAIVAAVEEDVAEQEAEEEALEREQQHLMTMWLNLSRSDGNDAAEGTSAILQNLLGELQPYDSEGRGKFHKRLKMLKYAYPLIVGMIIAKGVLIPLILKMLTALSTSSFVMSKIALITAGFIALKWIFSHGDGGRPEGASKRLEVVQLPPFVRPYSASGGGGGGGGGYWDDLSLSASNAVETKSRHRGMFIPVGGSAAAVGGPGEAVAVGPGPPNHFQRLHPHHIYQQPTKYNYDAVYDGKPFL